MLVKRDNYLLQLSNGFYIFNKNYVPSLFNPRVYKRGGGVVVDATPP